MKIGANGCFRGVMMDDGCWGAMQSGGLSALSLPR